MIRKVLILSSPDDAHARDVAEHLCRFQVETHFFKYDQFISEFSFDLIVKGQESPARLRSTDTGAVIDLLTIDSVWHRRPGLLKTPKFVEPWIGQLVEAEMRTAVIALMSSMTCRWVNNMESDIRCLQKLLQLRIADNIGLRIPKTIVTNEKNCAMRFYQELDGKVIYKLLSETSQRFIPTFETPPGIATMPLRSSDIQFLDQVKFAPHLFQEHISKKCDIRVTVIGKKLFATRIDSQQGSGAIDWRNDYSVEMTAFELPESVQRKCFALTREFGLNYGAIDLCLTPEEDFVFFEINCAGQYLWAERRTQQPMSLELAKLLAHEAEPLCPN